MLTTPNYGLEYAEGDDPAKNYPAVVDGPSKAKIDTALKANADLLAKLGLSGKRVVAAYSVEPVSAGGGVTVVFGTPFASNPVVLPMLADVTGASNIGSVVLSHATVTKTQFQCEVWKRDGTKATAGTIRIGYIAVGTAV